MADVVAIGGDLADGVAIGGDLADGVAIGEEVLDDDLEELEDKFEDVGVEGESSGETDDLDNCEVSLVPATHSQSMVLFRSRMTLALRWNEPEARPP